MQIEIDLDDLDVPLSADRSAGWRFQDFLNACSPEVAEVIRHKLIDERAPIVTIERKLRRQLAGTPFHNISETTIRAWRDNQTWHANA